MTDAALLNTEWESIDDVLLDMDGTLLDLDFDHHFWQTRVPEAWGAAQGLALAAARDLLRPRFAACEGTLAWYSTDHWSQELGLDIAALKRRDAERICWLPGARQFLSAVRARGKRLVLVTNAHPQAIAIKHERTGVLDYVDTHISSHDLGAPKEDRRFWQRLRTTLNYDPARSLFCDDSRAVLRAARAAGVGVIRAVCRPNSQNPTCVHEDFVGVDALWDLVLEKT